MTALLRLAVLALLGLVLFVRPADADAKGDAKAFIAKQLEVLKKGELSSIKAGFTKRLQERITKAKVEKGQREASKYTVDDLVDSAEAKGDSIKIKMKNGRTLTTLVKVDGKWFADTIWFN